MLKKVSLLALFIFTLKAELLSFSNIHFGTNTLLNAGFEEYSIASPALEFFYDLPVVRFDEDSIEVSVDIGVISHAFTKDDGMTHFQAELAISKLKNIQLGAETIYGFIKYFAFVGYATNLNTSNPLLESNGLTAGIGGRLNGIYMVLRYKNLDYTTLGNRPMLSLSYGMKLP